MTTEGQAIQSRRRAVAEAEAAAAPTAARDNAARCGSVALKRAMERSFAELAERCSIPVADARLLMMNGVMPA